MGSRIDLEGGIENSFQYSLEEESQDDNPYPKDREEENDGQLVPYKEKKFWTPVTIAGAVVGGTAAVVGGACVAAGAFGFSVTGILASSGAAALQSSIGNVAAGSLFATL